MDPGLCQALGLWCYRMRPPWTVHGVFGVGWRVGVGVGHGRSSIRKEHSLGWHEDKVAQDARGTWGQRLRGSARRRSARSERNVYPARATSWVVSNGPTPRMLLGRSRIDGEQDSDHVLNSEVENVRQAPTRSSVASNVGPARDKDLGGLEPGTRFRSRNRTYDPNLHRDDQVRGIARGAWIIHTVLAGRCAWCTAITRTRISLSISVTR